MRWLITSALVLLLFSSVVAEEAANSGRTLTPEQAQEEIQYKNDFLEFDNVNSLTLEVAAILAKHEGEGLSLPDLKSLTPDVAAALSAYKGELVLDGLETLSVETAKALAKHDGRLRLNSISSLPEDAALVLAKHQGDLCMQGLAELHCEPLARRLLLAGNSYRVGGDGGLNPFSLTSISPEVAELLVIAEQERGGLWLTELKSPSIDVLKVLARLRGDLILGIEAPAPEMASVLAAHTGDLALPVAKEIDSPTLATLATKEGGLELYLTTITPEVAMILSGFNGDLTLHVERLPEDIERVLAKSKASLSIPELKEIKTGELARKLVQAAPVVLPGDGQRLPLSLGIDVPSMISPEGWQLAVESLSPAVAEEIKAFRGLLWLRACETLPLDVEDILSECEGNVTAPALRELKSVKLARKLAEHVEDVNMMVGTYWLRSSSGLYVRNLSEISPDVAGALALHSGDYLLLEGLRSLSDDAAARLAEFPGKLSLASVTELSDKAQQNLGSGKVKLVQLSSLKELTNTELAKKIVEVDGLTTITAAVATVLAERSSGGLDGLVHGFDAQGTELRLNLKQLTPNIAAALATKTGNIEASLVLPALETVDAASATELARCGVRVQLPGLKKLTPEVAAAFANNQYHVVLDGVEEIPVEVARVLATTQSGYISFHHPFSRARKGPLKLPDESAALLQKHRRVGLPSKMGN